MVVILNNETNSSAYLWDFFVYILHMDVCPVLGR